MSKKGFPRAAAVALGQEQMRRNVRHAMRTIAAKRDGVVAERDDWEALRTAGQAIKDRVLRHLDVHLEQLERQVTAAGGTVHWARDAAEANAIVASLARAAGATEVVKVKSLATDEIELNAALAAEGITAWETDLAELIVQLAGDSSSHILVPAIHRNRTEIRDLFERKLGATGISDDPRELVEVARAYLRHKFLTVPVAVSGANFAVAESGTVCVVESEGNGRMCLTLPQTLITVMGIEKLLARTEDLEVMLQLLPRASTGERMNPYTSLWTGVDPADGPQAFHLVLLDAGRSATLADTVGRQALRCIRCSACLNVCPVYENVGGHAYESVYPGPIGAILSPQLSELHEHETLPWASSLCGACYEVCPVKIDIPTALVHLRERVVHERPGARGEKATMRALARVFAKRRLYEAAQRAARAGAGPMRRLPGPLSGWTQSRELPPVPDRTFRQWWEQER